MARKKILIVSMKAGWGHIKAAQALEEYAKNNLPELYVKHVDLCVIEPLLGKFFQKFYDISSNRFPRVWGKVYEAFDKELVAIAFQKLSKYQNLVNPRVAEYLENEKADAIIFTNVIAAPIIAPVCRKILPGGPLSVVVTDYHGHSYYNVEDLDRYFVAIPEVKDDLVRVGIEPDKISVTGIPVSPKFYAKYNGDLLRRRLGFKAPRETVLFISRMNKDFVVPTITGLLLREPKINLAVVCGGNDKLYKRIKEQIPRRPENFKLVNWTNRVDQYMKISDAVISKPGGLVISECLALGKQIIMTDPIPGQEEHNAELMTKFGYGKFAVEPENIVKAVDWVLAHPKHKGPDEERINPCAEILKNF